MGLEPMRLAPAGLESASLTTRTSMLFRGCPLLNPFQSFQNGTKGFKTEHFAFLKMLKKTQLA